MTDPKQKFVFFDRDGTLIEHIHYLDNPDLVKLKNDAIPAMTILKMESFKFGVITNQSVIGRRLSTVEKVNSVNKKLVSLLNREEIDLEFIEICPHAPIENCICRKPAPKLGLDAISKFDIDVSNSFMIGDALSDIEFGIKLGFKTILLSSLDSTIGVAHFVTNSLLSASQWIVSEN